MCQLRNPWGGKFEWKGRWSDKSDTWTPDLKKELKLEDKKDGIFWMDYEDFNDFFKRVQICKIHDKYRYSCEQVVKSNWAMMYFLIDTPGEHTFSIS